MKILHTSDWHLGHMLYNYSREEEQQHMLDQMVDIVKDQQPDAFLLSGDVYDTTQPSAFVQKMFADAIVRIHEACKQMTIVCIAGNHDSGSKHMIYKTPWKALNVNMIGSISKDSCLEDYIIKVEGKGYIVAVPFAAERFMPTDVYKELQKIVDELNHDEQQPVFLIAHMAVAKSDYRGHDQSTDDYIGGLYCQELEVFGDGYDYVALGHIHKHQTLDTERRIAYCGTPIAISFDEVYSGNDHGVVMIECDKHEGPLTTEFITIENCRPLVNLPHEGVVCWEDAKNLLDAFPDDSSAYLRLNVEVDDYLPAGANDEAVHISQGKSCRFCLINAKRKAHDTTREVKTFTTTEFKALDPVEVARMFVEAKNDIFDDDMKACLEFAKQEVKNNSESE